MEYYAHTAQGPGGKQLLDKRHWQPLREHLCRVAALARAFGTPIDLADEAELAGLLHDLGKYRDEFQQYLRNERNSGADTHHAVYGAAHAFINEMLPQAFAIAGHHAGLPDQHELCNTVQGKRYDAIDRSKPLLKRFTGEIGPLTHSVSSLLGEAIQRKDRLCIEFITRMVFSALVDADRLDTAG